MALEMQPGVEANWIDVKGRFAAAICPKCGGWTMMHADPTSSTANEWIRMAYVIGDLIVFWKNPLSLGVACPSEDRLPDDRTCA